MIPKFKHLLCTHTHSIHLPVQMCVDTGECMCLWQPDWGQVSSSAACHCSSWSRVCFWMWSSPLWLDWLASLFCGFPVLAFKYAETETFYLPSNSLFKVVTSFSNKISPARQLSSLKSLIKRFVSFFFSSRPDKKVFKLFPKLFFC